MSRNSKYIDAAVEVLQELGGGPVASKVLIDAIVDKGLLPNRKYLYHNVLKRVRESNLFDTSKRGYVSLVQPQEQPAPVEEVLPGQGPLAQVAGDSF
jgi:hypothetical protein